MRSSSTAFRAGFSLCVPLLAFILPLTAQQAIAPGWRQDFNNGTLAMRVGRPQDAVASFTNVTQENPDFAAGFFNLGLALSSCGRHAEAIAALEHAAKINPRLHGVHLFLGIEHYNLSQFAEAESALRSEVRFFPKDSKAWMWLGVVAMSEGKTADAVHALDEAAALDSDDVDIAYHRGRAHMQISQEIYADMLSKHPNSWRIHQVLAQSLDLQENKSGAIVEYRRAIEAAPNEPGLHDALGDLYWEQNQIDDAHTAYTEEARIDPSSASALYKTGAIAVQQSDSAAALPLLHQALTINPKLYGARFWLGRAEEGLGQFDAAAQDFEAVLKESTDDLDTQIITEYHLSQAYRKLHQTDKRSASLKRFEQLRKAQSDKSDERIAQKRRVQLGMNQENLDQEPKQDQGPQP